ncbi:MAG TPA: DinB family protein [Pyrinomonadaceae bacterium]
MSRPEKTEYAEYYETYVSLVEETDIVSALQNQLAELENIFASISEEKGAYAYAAGKWNIKELIGHLIDGERVFSYRAFRFSRADRTALASFEQDDYIKYGDFNNRPLADLVEEFSLLRKANLYLFKNLSAEAWTRRGTASDAPVSVRALAYIMVGHVRHHASVLKTRYLA